MIHNRKPVKMAMIFEGWLQLAGMINIKGA